MRPTRPALPHALRKKIDRLARRAHRFHRFAHHPLCDEYRGELIALGRRTRLCRGCAYAGAGVVLGAGLGLAVPATAPLAAWLGGAAMALATWNVARAEKQQMLVALSRPSKLATRAVPLFACSVAFFLGLRRGDALGFAYAAVAMVLPALLLARYRSRGPNRTACTRCPEQNAFGGCRGFLPILRRERAFARLARRWITTAVG